MAGDNYGIQHSGSGDNVNQGVQAVGPFAMASGNVAPVWVEAADGLLGELRQSLDGPGTQLGETQRTEARRQLDTLAEQVRAPEEKRDPGRIAVALGRLTAAVGTVTVLATKVEGLRAVIEQLLR